MADQAVYMEIHSFKKGDTIFREGDPGGCAYEVCSGKVAIVAGYGTNKETLLTELHEGDVFGEMGMVRGLPRSATAVAMDPRTDVSVITWEAISRYFKEKPAKIVQIMQQMGERISVLSDEYMNACGVIDELLEQRGELVEACKRQEKSLARLEEKLTACGVPKDVSAGEKQRIAPIWQKIEGESREMESERFRKYQEAYRNYRKRHGLY